MTPKRPDLMELGPNPTVRIGDVRSRRFDLIDRSRKICPVCNASVPNIAQHCADVGDDAHTVQLVHGS